MALSPNYGWAEPDNSSLVKNGAQDIRALGDAIDISVWNVGYGQGGKNKIINGDFRVAQRGTSITMGQNGYNLDRWTASVGTAFPTGTVTQQTFTPGNAIAGYEFANFARINPTVANGCTSWQWTQKIEDVRVFAGQTATISLWAKADASCTATVDILQNFGSGGSATVTALSAQSMALTTSWTRFTFTATFPSITGKTIGTGSSVDVRLSMPTSAGVIRLGSYDFVGVQLEYGSKATPFQTASGGSIQGELALCQRYYYKLAEGNSHFIGIGTYYSASALYVGVSFPVTMRSAPTLSVIAGTDYYTFDRNSGGDSFNDFTIYQAKTTTAGMSNTAQVSGTAGQSGMVSTGSNPAAFVAFSSEL
jgi:hypothetical protein